MMEIKSLYIDNMFCFGPNQKLIFEEPVYQVIGERSGIENQSNGTGKSSIYYALQEILYGKNIKKTLKEYTGNIFTDSANYSGVVEFSHQNSDIRVELIRKSGKVRLNVYRDGVDISDHTVPKTYKVIEELLGIDYELFTMLTYLSPTISTPNILFFGTPKEKKELFIRLFGLERIVKKVEKAKEKAKDLAPSISALERQLERLKKIKIPEKPKKPDLSRLDEFRGKLFDAEKKVKQLASAINGVSEWQTLLEEKESLLGDIENTTDNLPEWVGDDVYREQKQKLRDMWSQIQFLTQKLKELKNVNVVCPMCGSEIRNKDHIDNEISQVNEKLAALEAPYKELQNENESLKNIQAGYTILKEKKYRLNIVEAKLESMEIEALNLEDAKNKFNGTKQRVSLLKERIGCLEEDQSNYQQALAKYEAALEQNRTNEQEEANIRNELAELQKDVDIFSAISENLGYNGFVTAKILARANELTELINNYLGVFSNNSIAIRMLGSNKLNFKLLKDGKELPTNNLSAGQTTVLQLATILALRDLIQSNNGFFIDLIVLDELFGTLDEIRRSILIDTMREISLNRNQKILSISHLYFDPSLPTITVQQVGGVSSIIQ